MIKKSDEYGYPLVHEFTMGCSLRAENTVKDSTWFTFLACDEGLPVAAAPDTVNVNPQNSSYVGKVARPQVYPNSYVKNMRVETVIATPHNSEPDAIISINYESLWVAMSFEDIEASPLDGGTNLKTLLGLKTEDSNSYQIHPNWNGTDMDDAHDLSPETPGLNTDQKHEAVTIDWDAYEDAVDEDMWDRKLRDIFPFGPKPQMHRLHRERPYHTKRWYELPNKVRKANKNTYFGMAINVPQSGHWKQFWTASETGGVNHIRMQFRVRFNEYNTEFYQN